MLVLLHVLFEVILEAVDERDGAAGVPLRVTATQRLHLLRKTFEPLSKRVKCSMKTPFTNPQNNYETPTKRLFKYRTAVTRQKKKRL